jgi:opacity protein-like surface antigen
MKTHGLTTKITAKKPKNVRNCESWVSKFSPYVLAGGGGTIFHPTGNIGTFVLGVGTQAKGAFLYGGGADSALTTHFSLRPEYRGFVYKDPDFGVAA